MNKIMKNPGKGKKRKSGSLEQKIDAAQKKKAKLRASSTLPPVTVSPSREMTTAYTIVGLVFRALVLFMGVCGLMLFFGDAAKLVILNDARADSIVVDTSFVVLWSALITILMMALSLHKAARIASPFVLVGGIAAYMFGSYADPIGFVKESFRRLFDLILTNMADAGYTTYMQYVTEEPYSYNEELLVKFAVAAIIVITGIVLGYSMARRVYAAPVTIVCAIYMVPVFMFNLTRTNKGLALALIFICGVVALYIFDCIYGGIFAARKEKKAAKKAAKKAKKDAKKAKKAAKLALKNSAATAYNTAIEGGLPRSAAKKARDAVFAKDKKEKEDAKKAEAARIKYEKQQKIEAKRAAKEEKAAARLAKKEEAKKLRAKAAAVKKSKNPDDAAALKQAKADAKSASRAAKKEANKDVHAAKVTKFKTVAAGGYAGVMAMIIAFLSIAIPMAAVQKNFPIIDVINNKMQLVRTYVTAYLMGDDVDLNSLAMYGGVAELNPRNITFDTPQYTGQKLFSVESGYAAPVYMRSWIGTDYDLETDLWTSADSDEVLAYRDRFGASYTPDNITYFFNKYVYPTSLEVNKVDQYRNLDDYGFRVFQLHVRRVSGTSKILFVPSVMNAGLGIMDFGSIEHTEKKYSAYYDGIYSSRFFGEGTTYSTSSFNPVMKAEGLAENLEGSIEYYNLANLYADTIDAITEEISDNLLFDETREYTYETPLGEMKITGSDLSFLIAEFEEDVAEIGYKVKSMPMFVETYLAMTTAERKTFQNSFDKELNYRDYAEETYTTTFGSESIAELADQILTDAGIVQGEKYVHDKSRQETMNENQLKRLTPEERYGNVYDSWFTDTEGNVVPRHEAIMAVINYLRYNYEYTLDPECEQVELLDEDGNVVLDEEGNPIMVDHVDSETNLEAFLFEVKQGYCVHFATSAVALLRELGFAVRYDEGYIAANWNRTYDPEAVSTYRTSVRDYDAHSWIEVYYPAIGWVMYECTPSYCEDMYDLEDLTSSSTGSSGIDQSKVTVSTETLPEETVEVELGEDEVDYTALFIALGVVIGVLAALSIVWTILKIRAGRAIAKRRKLLEEAKDERRFYDGQTDIHQYARDITDAIFDILDGLGCPHEVGELPTEYALRIDADYADISKHKITDIMAIIEKEEFGGTLTFRELTTLAEYLAEIISSIYAGLPAMQKLRMRYFMNVI